MEHVYVQIMRFYESRLRNSREIASEVLVTYMYGQFQKKKTFCSDRKRECELSLTYTNVFSYTDLELVLGGISSFLLLKIWVIF